MTPRGRFSRKAGARVPVFLLAALALGGVSCSSTKLVSFSNARMSGNAPIDSVVTVMVDPRGDLRASVENRMALQFRERGLQAHPSYTRVPLAALDGDKEQARQALSVWGTDAVLVCKLTDRTDITEPPTFTSSDADWKQVWSTGSSQSTTFEADSWGGEVAVTVHLESKLYRLSDAELLWVGYAESTLKETTDDVQRIQSVVRKTVTQLKKAGWIK